MDSLDTIILAASVLSLLTGAATLMSTASLAQKKAMAMQPVLEAMTREVETLERMLRGIEEVLTTSSADKETVGEGQFKLLESSYKQCRARFYSTAKFLEVFWHETETRKSRLVMMFRYAAREEELQSAYRSLKESTILARDLASEIKADLKLAQVASTIHHQLAQLRQEMAILIADDAQAAQLELEYKNTSSLISEISEDGAQQYQRTENLRQSDHGGLRRMARRGMALAQLAQKDFIMDICLVIETPIVGSQKNETRQQQIFVRSLLDTGSTENLVSYDLLGNICKELLIPIPASSRVPLTGVLKDFTFTPEFEVILSWWKPTDLNRRTEKFLVVKDAPFEVLFSSTSFSRQILGQPVHISRGRDKSKKEVSADIEAEQAKREEALKRVKKEKQEAEAKNKTVVLPPV